MVRAVEDHQISPIVMVVKVMDEDVKAKRKRRARRKFHVTDFPLWGGARKL